MTELDAECPVKLCFDLKEGKLNELKALMKKFDPTGVFTKQLSDLSCAIDFIMSGILSALWSLGTVSWLRQLSNLAAH